MKTPLHLFMSLLSILLKSLAFLIGVTLPSIAQESPYKTPEIIRAPVLDYSVALTAKDKFVLAARYYPGEKKMAGVIVLHDCKSNSTVYEDIGKRLHKQGYHALVLDLRGFGKSISSEVSHQAIKRQAKDIVLYQQMLAQISAYWEEDVLAGFNFLRSKVDKSKGISFVVSGCSALYAVSSAEKMHVANMVLITPQMDFSGKERYKNLTDIPTYFVDSIHSVASYQTSKELFEWNGHSATKQLLFKGNRTNADLLRRNQSLISDIVMWLSERT